jgi:hypothetical protein
MFGDVLITIANDWNSFLGKLGSGGGVDAQGCFGAVRYEIASQR